MKINVNSIACKVEVDNRIPLRYYYRIADNLLKQVRFSLPLSLSLLLRNRSLLLLMSAISYGIRGS